MITRFSEMINTWLGWCPNVQMFQNTQTNTTIPPCRHRMSRQVAGMPDRGENIAGAGVARVL